MFNRKLIGNWIKGWRDKLVPTKVPIIPAPTSGQDKITRTEEKLGNTNKKTSFWIETEKFKCSPQKLSMLANQINRTRLSHAITQMQLSPKKASGRVHQLLLRGKAMIESSVRNNDERTDTEYWVRQAMVGRGSYTREIDYKAKGRFGIIRHPEAFIRVELAPWDPQADLARTLRAVISKAKQPTTPERYRSPAKINYH